MHISADKIIGMAQSIREQLVRDRRFLHTIPEIGTDLPKTSAYIKKRLNEMNITWKDCGGSLPEQLTKDYQAAGFPKMEKETGIIALIGHGSPCILLRADMDALPICEDNDLDFKATGTCSHMCGHDSHAAMLLGAAYILKQMEDHLQGTVKLMFQPGEETGAGARLMVNDGALHNPTADAAFAMHVQPNAPLGTVGFSTGVNSSSLDTFLLKIKGKGGHSSQPQLCIDPIMVANQIYQAVNLLVSREADPSAMVTLTCGVLQAGTAVNIIPDEAKLQIGMRTLDVEAADHLTKRIPEVIDCYAKAWRADYDLTIFHTPCTLTDETLCRELVPHIQEITGPDSVHEIAPMSATEDFGYVTAEIPGMFAFIGAGQPGNAPLHSPKMILDENILPTGAAIFANTAASWLEEHAS